MCVTAVHLSYQGPFSACEDAVPIAQASDNVSVIRAPIAPAVPPRPGDLVIPMAPCSSVCNKVGDAFDNEGVTHRTQREEINTVKKLILSQNTNKALLCERRLRDWQDGVLLLIVCANLMLHWNIVLH